MEYLNENQDKYKQRHGCVTAWLIFIIIINSLSSIIYLFAGDHVAQNYLRGLPKSVIIFLGLFGIANVVFAVLLLKWKKIGFWGFLITSVLAIIMNLSIGFSILQSLVGLIGVAILFGILQIKQDNVSAWDNLE